MRSKETYLLDMLLNARQALAFVEGMTLDEFLNDTMAQDAVIRRVQVVGEAARHISEAFRHEHSDIPWSAIIGTRTILVHLYFKVDLNVVWKTVNESLPALIELLAPMFPEPDED